ncbi:MYCBP-associated protein [Anableps anableps]
MLEEVSRLDDPDATNTARNIQSPRLQCSEKLYKPKPPKSHQDPELGVVPNEDGNAAEAAPLVKDSQQLDCSAYLRFDERGMILPHSILGSLDDFRSYLEARGEKNLLEHFPKPFRDPACEAKMWPSTDTTEREVSHQRNALQNWDKHMTCRRQKQEELSCSLSRPVETLLMNQDKHFRETTEQREILNQVMPFAHSGYGYRVGSEFWSIPQHYGDELSGISATLTQTERGLKKPITRVGHPDSIQKEMGIITAGTERPFSRAWGQSAYLHLKSQELGDILQDMEFKKPDISKLEVIGTGKPLSSMSEDQGLLPQKEEEEMKENVIKEETPDSLAETADVQVKALPFPALRINGQLATWTGHPMSDKGEVGLSTSILFECQTEELASTDLELCNEGNTVIFYSWKKLPRQQSFSHLYPQKNRVRFYFKFCSGVIHPSETLRVEFIFKSEEQGFWTEVWQLNTHPLLLQGASIQIRLSGTALKQDKTADQRRFIENKLEKVVVENFSRSIVCEIVKRVHTPERPKSPAELYITEEQLFQKKNPTLQYHYGLVEDLKTLWQQVNPEGCWDFSVASLRQAVLSLPDAEPSKEESFTQLNSLYLQLCEPPAVKHHLLTPTMIGRLLWMNLLDLMGGEAIRLRAVMCLPEKETWADVAATSPTDDKTESQRELAATEKSDLRSKNKDNSKSEMRSPTDDIALEENKIRGKKKDDAGKRSRERQGKDSDSLGDINLENPIEVESIDEETLLIYRRTLHKKVYAWMTDLVGNLCDLMDDILVGDGQIPNCCA